MSKASAFAPLVVNGWTLVLHPLFLTQLSDLVSEVKTHQQKAPHTYKKKNAAKRLAAITHLCFEAIPKDPSSPVFRQGKTLGEAHRHWHRAKFYQQYRLFFRYHTTSRVIVFVWVNDTKTKRAYESKSDAYRVFSKMLTSGNPPDDWDALIKASSRDSQALYDSLMQMLG